MTENVLMFDDMDDEKQIAAVHLGLPRLVLEGKDDVRLFRQFWFQGYLDQVDFIEAAELVVGSGCTAVAAAVRKSREEDGITAFGMVDRDWLFKCGDWGKLFDPDDASFEASTVNGVFYTTRRWEIEAYLLEPDLLAPVVRSYTKTAPRPEAECQAALGRAVEESHAMLMTQAMYCASHTAGQRHPPMHLTQTTVDQLVQASDAILQNFVHPQGKVTAAAVDTLVAQVLAHAPVPEDERWLCLLRFVDTKRLIARLQVRFGLVGDVRWHLAQLMASTGRRPHELEARLKLILA